MNQPEWMSDPALAKITPVKMAFLQKMFSQGTGLGQKELLSFFMEVAKQGKRENISFTPEEMKAVVQVLKKNSSPDEQAKIDKIMSMKKK